MGERDIRDVAGPHLVDPRDLARSEQVRVLRVLGGSATRIRLGRQRLQAHQPHQPLNALAIDVATAFGFENLGEFATAEERHLQVQFVDAAHQREFLGIGRDRLVVETGSAEAEQLALTPDRNPRLRLDQRAAPFHRRCPSPRAKKSRSTVSSPIFLSNSSSRSLPPPPEAVAASRSKGAPHAQ